MKTFLVQLCAEPAERPYGVGDIAAARVTAVVIANDAVEAKVAVLDHIMHYGWKPLNIEFARELEDTHVHILDFPIQRMYRQAKQYGIDAMFEVSRKPYNPNVRIDYRPIFKNRAGRAL